MSDESYIKTCIEKNRAEETLIKHRLKYCANDMAVCLTIM